MEPGPAFDVLLLDFGGVCLLNPVELHSVAEAALGLSAGTFTWLGPVDPSTDQLWQAMIDGQLSEREYWARRAADVGEAAGRELSLPDYMKLIYDPPTPDLIRPGATATVTAAQADGIRASVLSNDLEAFHGPEWQNGVAFFDLIDHIVDCSATNILKPDPRAFSRALEIIGTTTERVLFVDDQPRNVDGALAAGIESVWFDVAQPDRSWREVNHRLRLPL